MSGLSKKDKLAEKRKQQAVHKEKRVQENKEQIEQKKNVGNFNSGVREFWSSMGLMKPAKTKLVIERRAVGLILGLNEHGNLAGVRCYHSFNGQSKECDCTHNLDGTFTLSRDSQIARAKGKLTINEDFLDKQKQLALNGPCQNPWWNR